MAENQYTHGPVDPRTKPYATFETKPTITYTDTKHDTGGGYERWRSTEWRDHTSRRAKEDVYVAVHRLAAIVWCYPDDMSVAEITDHLDGKDVHHTSGVEWDNRESCLTVVDHGRHAEITQAEMRAWAADSKQRATAEHSRRDRDECEGCGATDASFWTAETFEGVRCTACAMAAADGATLREA